MKKLSFLIAITTIFLFAGCGIQEQANKLVAFEKCKYDFTSVDSMYLAGLNVKQSLTSNGLDLTQTPRLALAILRKDVPLEARVNLQIKNPSAKAAAINEFEYILMIQNHEITAGTVAQAVQVPANGGVTNVPIRISCNLINLISDKNTRNDISDFFSALGSNNSSGKSLVTIKIKPTFGFGSTKIKYPGYITINKDVSKKILL